MFSCKLTELDWWFLIFSCPCASLVSVPFNSSAGRLVCVGRVSVPHVKSVREDVEKVTVILEGTCSELHGKLLHSRL